MLWSNFALHFLKQLNPYYYNKMPLSFTESSATNFCALLIMVEPFIFLSKNKYLKDYCYYVGILSSLAAYAVPVALFDLDLTRAEDFFEVVRYYACHAPLLICGVLMVKDGHHKLDYKRFWAMPLLMVGANIIIILNGLLMFGIAFPGYTQDIKEFMSRTGPLSGAACFGPPIYMDSFMEPVYNLRIPLLQYYINAEGEKCWTPALWMLVPLYMAAVVLVPLMSYPFQKREMQLDYEMIKQRIHMRKRAR